MFGDFRISRNITTAEGCRVCCKYMVHYDLLAKEIQFVGKRQGARCIKQNTDACPRSKKINRMVYQFIIFCNGTYNNIDSSKK